MSSQENESESKLGAVELDRDKLDAMLDELHVIPVVGSLVYYYAYGTPKGEYPANVERCAFVTQVHEPGNPQSPVGICVLNPTGIFFHERLNYGPGEAGHWGWPTVAAGFQLFALKVLSEGDIMGVTWKNESE